MTLHHMNKDDRMRIAMRSEEILSTDPTVNITGLAHRLGLKSGDNLYKIRRECGYPSLKIMKGRK